MSFNTAQHAVETITRQYDDYIEQGLTRSAALDYLALEHGAPRHKLAAILNDRDAGLHGASGETVYGVVANDAPRFLFARRLSTHPAVRAAREREKAIFFAERYGARTGRFDASRPNLSSPTTADHKPAHGGYLGVVDPGTVRCPDAPPEWL